jgi:hypothetical protein
MLSNTAAREKARSLVDALRRGEITNFEFEDSWPKGGAEDPALRAIETMLWNFYSELEPVKMVGEHRPSEGVSTLFERCMLFLRTALPYEWEESHFAPPGNLLEFVLAASSSSGQAHPTTASNYWRNEWLEASVWPFRRRGDLEAPRLSRASDVSA